MPQRFFIYFTAALEKTGFWQIKYASDFKAAFSALEGHRNAASAFG
jgi:hypothetical protein